MLDDVPKLLRSTSRLVELWSQEGVVLHAETLAAQATHRARQLVWLFAPLWLAAGALIAIAVALFLAR
jgi:type VI protein secretion system component VasF